MKKVLAVIVAVGVCCGFLGLLFGSGWLMYASFVGARGTDPLGLIIGSFMLTVTSLIMSKGL